MVAVCRRLIAPNVQKKVFLPGGATATSTSAVQVSDLTCDSDRQIYFTKLSTYTKIEQIDKSWLYGVNSVYIPVTPSIMYAGIGITLFEMMWKESPWMYWFWECISPY